MGNAINISGINIYPVKSFGGIELESSQFTERGLEHDRDYMAIDSENNYQSQRQLPEMTLISTKLGEKGIELSAPDMKSVILPNEIEDNDTRLIHAVIHGSRAVGQLVDDEVSDWVSEFLKKDLRLIRVRTDKPRYIQEVYRKPEASNQVGFADGFSISLASKASLNTLDANIPMNRFRPNIVVDGESLSPYDEDHWLTLKIGDFTAFLVKPIDRCVIPDIDQETAEVGKDVRKALARSRKGFNRYDPSNKGIFFAQNLNHIYIPGQSISVGDEIEVELSSEDPNIDLSSFKK